MDDKNQTPLEIPDNNPQKETKPIMSAEQNHKKKMRVIKFAYAFAIILAIGGALLAKIATEKTLGNLNAPIEQDYITVAPSQTEADEPDFEVRQNMTDVPDTREETTPEATQVTETSAPTTQAETIYATPYKDYYTLPLTTDISKDFLPNTPTLNTTTDDWRTHPAVDFKGTEGAQVKAISKGTIVKIYDDALLGTVAEIDHGNQVIAKYCGLNKDTIELKAGEFVSEGQIIGYLGTVPYEKSELPHLHFEIIYKGEKVDPLELMGK